MAASSLLLSASSELLQIRAANSMTAILPPKLHLFNYFDSSCHEQRTHLRLAHLSKANLKSGCWASLSEVAKVGENFAKVGSPASAGTIPSGQLLKVAETAAKAGAEVVMEAVSKPRNISYKGTTDLVTDTDKRSETIILDVVRKNFMDHLILGEEGGLIGDTSSDYLWCIDPLDGTTNFAHGYPSFAVSVGVLFRGKPAAAAVVEQSLFVTGFGYEHDDAWATNVDLFKEFTDISRGVRRLGAAAVDMCHVALGIVEAYWEYRLKPWDMAAGVLIVEEAGGTVTRMDGGNFCVFDRSVLVSNGILHKKTLTLFPIVLPWNLLLYHFEIFWRLKHHALKIMLNFIPNL
ncbi:unnamed protein product [Victoria cruziana]